MWPMGDHPMKREGWWDRDYGVLDLLPLLEGRVGHVNDLKGANRTWRKDVACPETRQERLHFMGHKHVIHSCVDKVPYTC